ncbi:hypothetical protein MKW94_016013 [Papaver nudicaule]|uniref:Cytochrome b561 and DOMON domain-containing protein n=1 Tax=Papaver nudicaule TaxID=74823 RepID=A0AA41VGF3_PAPNU|nr:hypothetical protein [Papaver nudicaule]
MASTSSSRILLLTFLLVLFQQAQISNSLTCSSQKFNKNQLYKQCTDLPQLKSYLHWTYDSTNSSLDIAFIAPPDKPDGWVAWAINPTSTGMAGSQTLAAYKRSDGSMTVKTYDVKSYNEVVQGKIGFQVSNMEAEYVDGVIKMYASIVLPESYGKVVNHVWQVGASLKNENGDLNVHGFSSDNKKSYGKLDLMSGSSGGGGGGGGGGGSTSPPGGSGSATSGGGISSKQRKANIHGILNAVSWGMMFPIGAFAARYLRVFQSADPAWFYIHVFCQLSGYVLGVAGWATGLQLGKQAQGYGNTLHRNIGITLFTFATLQIFALLLRPRKDHKLRFYWNIYHHGLGYGVLVLGIINVFKGLNLLQPLKVWKTSYIIFLCVLAGIVLVLEVLTWVVVLKRKSDKNHKGGYNGATAL